jgi:hypothetical protein
LAAPYVKARDRSPAPLSVEFVSDYFQHDPRFASDMGIKWLRDTVVEMFAQQG